MLVIVECTRCVDLISRRESVNVAVWGEFGKVVTFLGSLGGLFWLPLINSTKLD